MKPSRLALVVVCVAVVACTQEMTQREALLLHDAVEGRTTAWVRAWNNADRDSLAQFYDQSADLTVMWADGRRTDGWEATGQAIRDFYGGINYMNFVVTEPQIEVLGPTAALVTFRHSTDIVQRNAQRMPVRAGQGVVLWVRDRQDNVWRIRTSYIAISEPSRN